MTGALAFLTVFGRGTTPDGRTFRWFWAAGLVIGTVVAGTWWASWQVWNPAVAAALAVAANLAVTGMLHVDGLADSADGLIAHLDRPRRLEVMRQPDVGAFALAVVPAVLLLQFAALTSADVQVWAIVGLWSVTRAGIAVVPSFTSYARPTGLASSFLAGTGRWLLLGLVPGIAVMAWAQGVVGGLAAVAAIAGGAAVVVVAHRRIGGFTGDVLGAALVVAETVGLLGLAVQR